jgi:micrococcal nuclease
MLRPTWEQAVLRERARSRRRWPRGPTLEHRLWRERRIPWRRIASRPRIAVLAVLAAAIAGWLLPDLRADSVVVLRVQPVAVSDAFRLCAGRRQPNCVVDGDTIWHGGVKIRIADIDTPEIFTPKCASEAALGRQATERLLELINTAPFEIVPSGSRDADRYGRKLRILERHGRSLGDTLVAEGLARPWDGARRSWCG